MKGKKPAKAKRERLYNGAEVRAKCERFAAEALALASGCVEGVGAKSAGRVAAYLRGALAQIETARDALDLDGRLDVMTGRQAFAVCVEAIGNVAAEAERAAG